MKATILTASTGSGHTSAAKAVEAALSQRGVSAKTFDALQYAPFAFRKWYGDGYEFIVRTRPQLYGRLYHVSDVRKGSYLVQTMNDYMYQARLRKLIIEERPDWVVCTHSLPQPRLAALREELGFFRIAVVVTDLYPHLMWLRGAPDHYFVPNEWTKEILIKRRRHLSDRITVTGIPVHPLFSQTFSVEQAKQVLGWDGTSPLITITSGGIGGGPFLEAVEQVASLQNVHLEVICGRNERRKKRLEEATKSLPNVHVRGNVSQEEMAIRMTFSQLFISKPGGLTTSECLAIGCPMLVYEPFLIPGQEEGNADFLEQNGCGVRAGGPRELVLQLQHLLEHPEKVQAMRCAAKSHGKPHAADEIAQKLLEMS